MKKQPQNKQLVLAKERIRNLVELQLAKAVGGGTSADEICTKTVEK